MSNIVRTSSFQIVLFGHRTYVSVCIDVSFKTHIDFTLHGRPYTFVITDWENQGLKRFLELFYATLTPRDPALFGVMIDTEQGYEFLNDDMDMTHILNSPYTDSSTAIALTMAKKLNAIEHACYDVIRCLSKVGDVYPQSLLEYCIWYLELPYGWNYAEMITRVMAKCVVGTQFMVPDLHWTVVEFS